LAESVWSFACEEKDSVLIKRQPHGGLLCLKKLGEMSYNDLARLEKEDVIAIISSLTGESEMIVLKAKVLRRFFKDNSLMRGSVGFLPVEVEDEEVVVVLCDYGDEKDVAIWWLHLFFE